MVQFVMCPHSYSIPRFPFHDPDLSPDHSAPPVVLQASEGGLCHGLVVWWTADMEGSELSMDPWNYQQVRSIAAGVPLK